MLNDREIIEKVYDRWYHSEYDLHDDDDNEDYLERVLVRYARWLEKGRWQELIDYGTTYLISHGQVEYQDFDDEGR
jgi:hypothetical protein